MRHRIKEYLTPDEIVRLKQAPDLRYLKGKRDAALISIMLSVGPRSGEVMMLKYKDLIKQNGVHFLVIKNLKKRKVKNKDVYKTKDVYREIPLSSGTVEKIMRYKNSLPFKPTDEDFMFWTMQTGKYQPRPITKKAIDLVVRRYLAEAKIKKHVHPHALRRTFATCALQEGTDLATLMSLLGHQNLSSTQCYTVTSTERKVAAVESVSYGD